MTSGSAMHAMIRTAPPQDEQILESMPQSCFERQVYVRLRALIHPHRLAAQGRERAPREVGRDVLIGRPR